MLVTMDVEGLFTNIVHEDGLKCLKEELDERNNPKVPTEYLLKLMDIILNHNIFSFHESLCGCWPYACLHATAGPMHVALVSGRAVRLAYVP